MNVSLLPHPLRITDSNRLRLLHTFAAIVFSLPIDFRTAEICSYFDGVVYKGKYREVYVTSKLTEFASSKQFHS